MVDAWFAQTTSAPLRGTFASPHTRNRPPRYTRTMSRISPRSSAYTSAIGAPLGTGEMRRRVGRGPTPDAAQHLGDDGRQVHTVRLQHHRVTGRPHWRHRTVRIAPVPLLDLHPELHRICVLAALRHLGRPAAGPLLRAGGQVELPA